MLSFLSSMFGGGKCAPSSRIEGFEFSPEGYTIIDVETRDQMFELFIESGGKDTLFRTQQDGYIWSITIHYDRVLSKQLNSDASFIPPNASDRNGYPINSMYPTNDDCSIDRRYLCSSSTLQEDSFDTHWIFKEQCSYFFDYFLGDKYLVATVLNNPKRPTCFIDTLEKHDRFNSMFVEKTNFPDYKISVDWGSFYTHFNSLVMYKTFHYNVSSHYDYCEMTFNFEKGEDLYHTRLLSEDEIDQIYIKNGKQPLFNELVDVIKDECESAHDKESYDNHHYSDKELANFNNLYHLIPDSDSDITEEHFIQKSQYDEKMLGDKRIINLSKFAKIKLFIKILLNFDDMDSIEKFNQMVDTINLAYQTIYDFDDIVLKFDIESISNGYDACKAIFKREDESEDESEGESDTKG